MAVPKVLICHESVQGLMVASSPALREVALGRKKSPDSVMTKLVRFVDYLGDVPAPPASKSWLNDAAKSAVKLMYGNDQYGDCVIASYFHGVGVSSAQESGAAIVGTTQEAISEYQRVCGPGDNGCYIPDVKNAALTGLTIGGKKRKIFGFAAVDPANKLAVQTAILISGGGFNIGFNVPSAWMGSNTYDGAVWDVPHSFNFVGGHDIRAIGYNETGVQFMTWGITITMTWAALADSRIVDEAYIEFEADWDTDGEAPSGLKTAELTAAIAAYNAGQVPDWKPNTPAVLSLTATPSTVQVGDTVEFSVTLPTGIPYGVLDFGDGSPTATVSVGAVHSYSDPGSYYAVLTTPAGSTGASVSVTTAPPVPPVPPTPPAPVVMTGKTAPKLIEVRQGIRTIEIPIPALDVTVSSDPGAALPEGKINPAVIADAIALVLAVISKDPVAIANAIAKLLADLGKATADKVVDQLDVNGTV